MLAVPLSSRLSSLQSLDDTACGLCGYSLFSTFAWQTFHKLCLITLAVADGKVMLSACTDRERSHFKGRVDIDANIPASMFAPYILRATNAWPKELSAVVGKPSPQCVFGMGIPCVKFRLDLGRLRMQSQENMQSKEL